MKVLSIWTCCLVLTLAAFAQSDRGTITGTVSDPTSAVVQNATVVAQNSGTGAQYQTTTTATGNYTLPSLPAGVYNVSVEVPGFKKFTQQGITVQVAQTARIDLVLQVGGASESVIVNADAPLLKTESADQSMTISRDNLNALPLNFGGGGGSMGAIRSPLNFIVLTPGTSGTYTLSTGGTGGSINGIPGNNFKIVFDGQDTTSGNTPDAMGYNQPSVDAIQEFALQTSNFVAEFGQVGGGLFNFTSRSGTNQFHGSAYEFFANEALDANRPFVNYKPIERKNDFGGTVGGPVWIPKVYNGRDKTFFFFSYEMFRNNTKGAGTTSGLSPGTVTGTYATLPTDAMRNGDFSQILTGRVLGTDPLGRPIMENAIYDPASARTVNGQIVTDPFLGNIIPKSRFDPVAVKIQSLIPSPTNTGLINNWFQNAANRRIQAIPALKLDHSFASVSRLSFYWSRQRTDLWAAVDGLPTPITGFRDQHVHSDTYRMNYDHTLTPTLLMHLGFGYIRFYLPDSSPDAVLQYDAAKNLGFVGASTSPGGFPRISGLSSAFGGMSLGMGPTNANHYYNDKLTSAATVTYVRGNHTYKAGGEFRIDMWTDRNSKGAQGILNFTPNQTALPYLSTASIGGGTIGFPYASFLLGLVDNASVNALQDPQLRKKSWAFFIQDTWKITRRLTLDYGLRWDYQGQGHEIHYRFSEFSGATPNPSAGGLPGGLIYQGYGPGRCNCLFTIAYPYAIGPRLGVAYQIDSKTVLRAGWGLVYSMLPGFNWFTNTAFYGVGFDQKVWANPGFGQPGAVLQTGLQYNVSSLYQATLNPGAVPSPGQLNGPTFNLDPNGGRPGRINQWTIGIQREIMQNLVVEAAYVGNRGVWLEGDSLVSYNAIPPGRYQALGLNVANAADRQLLTSPLNSPLAQQAGFKAPYAGYPLTATVAQSLRPFPQFSSSLSPTWAPLGDSWYDSLQMKLTKRVSHGLNLQGAFTWAKTLASPAGADWAYRLTGANDVFNRPNQKSVASYSQPLVLVVSFEYKIPEAFQQNRLLHLAASGWTLGGLLQYASGLPIPSPGSVNNLAQVLFQSTRFNRVPGQPLYLKDLNCHCIDPNKQFVLNPNAWSDAGPGQWGTSSQYYNDFRYARVPNEQLSFGRTFRIREGMSLQVRAEFFNVFNRTFMAQPNASNPLQTQTSNLQGVPISGFGRIDATAVSASPRSGQIVARFRF